MIGYLVLIGIGLGVMWLGFKIAEEVMQIALVSTGAIALVWGFAIAPSEIQLVLETLSIGGLLRLRR